MELFVAALVIISICFVGFGLGVLFFGRTANAGSCGEVPEAAHEDCPSQKAGLCPIEDTSGALKLLKATRINFKK